MLFCRFRSRTLTFLVSLLVIGTPLLTQAQSQWVGTEGFPLNDLLQQSFESAKNCEKFQEILTPELAHLALRCQEQGKTKIVVACTFDCQEKNKLAFQKVAAKMGLTVEFQNLQQAALHHESLQQVDLILYEGGADVLPEFYQGHLGHYTSELALSKVRTGMSEEQQELWSRKDYFERDFLLNYMKNSELAKTPLLAICRGMQLLGAVSGAPLYADLMVEAGVTAPHYQQDQITIIDQNSLLASIFPHCLSFEGWENHHQGIHTQAVLSSTEKLPFKVVATSHQGQVIEAIEFPDYPILGVQFHPELSEGHVQSGVIGKMLSLACEK